MLAAAPEAISTGAKAARKRQQAAVRTRPPKLSAAEEAARSEQVRAEAARFGLTTRRLARLLDRAEPTPWSSCYAESLAAAAAKLTEQSSHFSERDLVREVCERLQAYGVPAGPVVRQVLCDVRRDKQFVSLVQLDGQRQYTTREMWRLEKRLMDDVHELHRRTGAIVAPEGVSAALRGKLNLSEEQRDAVRTLLADQTAIRTLTGVAGSGKSTTLDAVHEGFRRSGYRVVGAALAGKAKEELAAKTGIPSRTLASYFFHLDAAPAELVARRLKHDVRMLLRAAVGQRTYRRRIVPKFDARTVFVLDEAGMISTREMQRLTKQILAAGATLILVGDAKQLPPIGAGGPLNWVTRHATSATLFENQRQRLVEEHEAVADFRRGRPDLALQRYVRCGKLSVGVDRKEAMHLLVDAWRKCGGAHEPKRHVVLTLTSQGRCRSQRALPVGAPGGACASAAESAVRRPAFLPRGSRAVSRAPLRQYGVENGFQGTILRIDPLRKRICVQLDQPAVAHWRKGRPLNQVEIPLRRLAPGDVTLGYAATTHKLQGATVDHAYLLAGGPLTSLQSAYTQASRARLSTRIFVDEPHAGPNLRDLAEAMQRSAAKPLAHALAKPSPAPEPEKPRLLPAPTSIPSSRPKPSPHPDL